MDMMAYRLRRGFNRLGVAVASPFWLIGFSLLMTSFQGWLKGTQAYDPKDMLAYGILTLLGGLLCWGGIGGMLGWVAAGFASDETHYLLQRKRVLGQEP